MHVFLHCASAFIKTLPRLCFFDVFCGMVHWPWDKSVALLDIWRYYQVWFQFCQGASREGIWVFGSRCCPKTKSQEGRLKGSCRLVCLTLCNFSVTDTQLRLQGRIRPTCLVTDALAHKGNGCPWVWDTLCEVLVLDDARLRVADWIRSWRQIYWGEPFGFDVGDVRYGHAFLSVAYRLSVPLQQISGFTSANQPGCNVFL